MGKLRAFAAACFVLLAIPLAYATQQYLAADDNTSIGSMVMQWINGSGKAQPVSAANPMPVSGSFSATLNGFTPNGSFGTLTSTQAGSASTALPTGTVVDLVNTGTTAVSCTPATGTATPALNNLQVAPGDGHTPLVVGSFVNIACKNQGGDTASNVIVMAGGSGLANTSGGGGGSGGGGAVTIPSGGVASGAYAAGAFSSGAAVDGWNVTMGAKADAVCGTATGTCGEIALLKYIANASQQSPPLTVNGAVQAWTGLTPGTAQTGTIVAANTDKTSVGGTAIGAMANFGTSPGAVKGEGVNASIFLGTTAPSTGSGASGAGTQRVTPANDTAAGLPPVKSSVPVVNGGNIWNTTAASQTAVKLSSTNGGTTGTTGDYLSHCVITPTSTSPGAVQVFDGTNTAANDVINFAGGASSVSNLVPFSIPVGALSINGAWEITTGANVSVSCYGKFT